MNIGEKGTGIVDKDSLAADLFEAISHPTRIQILKTLRDTALGFAELKNTLGISSSGNLSHHLGKLDILVKSNNQGKYELTEQGREALFALNIVRDPIESGLITAHAWIVALTWYAIWVSINVYLASHDWYLTLVEVLMPTVLSTIIFSVSYWMLMVRKLRKGTIRFTGLFSGYTGVLKGKKP